jgi:hypothetical protein
VEKATAPTCPENDVRSLHLLKSANSCRKSREPTRSKSRFLCRRPTVQQAIANEFARLGMEKKDAKQYFQILWSAALNSSHQAERDRLQSWRLLSRLYLPSENPSAKNEAPAMLRIANVSDGIAAMGFTPEMLKPAQANIDLGQFSEGLKRKMRRICEIDVRASR